MHIPVLQKEVIKYLKPEPNENFIDCTVGEGGHSLAILEATAPKGKVLGIDQDSEVLKNTKYKIQDTRYKNRLILVCGNFANLKEIARKFSSVFFSGILLDLGICSWHFEESGRGFSFLKNEPLDMRYNSENPLTAEKILNFWSESEIEKILREFGEERFSKNIAKEIVRARKEAAVKTTFQLIKIIERAIPGQYKREKKHFATRTFQTLRIAVNKELSNLENVLPQALEILKPGGRLVVISFHSLEDKIVKNFFREKAKENLINILAKKPIRPSQEEIKINFSSRSSRLRAAIKI
ncbi:MAG: 16S rRNA (cytosine(1402)-N(4))-methyltransferase RsmH [bacterium]